MTGGSGIREDVKRDSSRVSYEDERYFVGISSRETDAHNLLVNEAYAYIGRGIVKELARADAKRLRSSLEMIAPVILSEIDEKRIPIEELGWVLAKAAIREEEEFAAHLSSQLSAEK